MLGEEGWVLFVKVVVVIKEEMDPDGPGTGAYVGVTLITDHRNGR